MVLGKNDILRGSGDDLNCFYYNPRHEESWIPYQAVGRRLTGPFVTKFGGDPTRHYRVCFRVWGMGDGNACDIAQATHEGILRSHGVLEESQTLQYRVPVPKAKVWQGVYIDDLLICNDLH